MRQSLETDKICIEKIIKYIRDIEDCFEHFKIESYEDLKSQRIAQFAITQLITNIYELKKNISAGTLSKLITFDKLKLAGARNIASHNYEHINFRMVNDICKLLISDNVVTELNGVINHAKDGSK